jgi:hypothetical protein
MSKQGPLITVLTVYYRYRSLAVTVVSTENQPFLFLVVFYFSNRFSCDIYGHECELFRRIDVTSLLHVCTAALPHANPESPCSAWMTSNEFGRMNDGILNAQIMKVLLVVACSLLLFTLLLSIPAVDALQGKRLDSAISNVATPET